MRLGRILWLVLWRTHLLFLALAVGCSGLSPVVRVEPVGRGRVVVHIPRTVDWQPVVLGKGEFHKALRQLARQARLTGTPRQTVEKMFQMEPQSGNYLYLPRDKKLVPMGRGEYLEGTLAKGDLETAERYRLWCQRVHSFYGDCLGGLLVEGRYLDMHGRYIWALALSKSPVLDELKTALGEMVEVRALISTVLWTLGSMLLILALNPVAPALVAAVSLGLILYVGIDTLLNLVTGWLQLMEEVKDAATFEQIRDAGERFGKILGREAARALALVLMAAIGTTAQQFATKVPVLPGSAQVALQAEGTAGLPLPALGAVQEIALAAEGVSVTVAATAMTMAGSGSGGKAVPCIERHHIATICNDKDSKNGGPWTPRFRRIFAKAGMSMEDPANKMPLRGHYGPHPKRYHEIIHEELLDATLTCRSAVECREALTGVLRKLAKQIATPGTELNRLVTRQ